MVHHSDRDPRPGDATLVIGDLGPSSPPFYPPRRLVMFATAWAPCLCASEARPSDQGIQVLGRIRPHHPRQALRLEGDRCSGPGICTCESA